MDRRYFGPYVLAIWEEISPTNNTNKYIGLESAAPLFFEIIDAIEAQLGVIQDRLPNPKTLHLHKVKVCEASGLLPMQRVQKRFQLGLFQVFLLLNATMFFVKY